MCNVRVLIVDDNATNRELLTTRLTSWGMRTLEAQDGPAALQALDRALDENDPFRIAVIDMQMPGMDGETLGRIIHTATHIKRDTFDTAGHLHTFILLTSGVNSDILIQRCLFAKVKNTERGERCEHQSPLQFGFFVDL